MNQQTLSGKWRQLRGKVKSQWGKLTDDELDHAEGNVEQLVGLIQQKSGESKEAIEHKLNQLCGECGEQTTAQKVADTASEYAEQASETAAAYAQGMAAAIHDSSESVNDAVRAGIHQTEEFVKQRPVESLAATFGAGLIAGVVVGLLIRQR